MTLFCAAIRRDSVSLLRFLFLSHVQVFLCEISLVFHLKCPHSCFSYHFCFLVNFVLLMLVLSLLLLVAVINLPFTLLWILHHHQIHMLEFPQSWIWNFCQSSESKMVTVWLSFFSLEYGTFVNLPFTFLWSLHHHKKHMLEFPMELLLMDSIKAVTV